MKRILTESLVAPVRFMVDVLSEIKLMWLKYEAGRV